MAEVNNSYDRRSLTGNASRQITFEDLGIPRIVAVRPTIIGNIRTSQNISPLEWVLLIGGLLLVFITFGLAVDRFIALDPRSPDIVFGFLLIYNGAFAVYYVINGVFKERAFEVLAFVLTTIVAIIYVTISFIHEQDAGSRPIFKITAISSILILGTIMSIMGIIVGIRHWKSGNLIFRTVGAEPRMQSMCQKLFTTITLLHFDIQLVGSFLILTLEHGFSSFTLVEVLFVTLGLVWIVCWALLSYFSLRWESKCLVFSSIFSGLPQYALILYFLAKSAIAGRISAIFYCRYSAGILGFVIHTLSLIFLVLCYKNFNQGLREKVFPLSLQNNGQVVNDRREDES